MAEEVLVEVESANRAVRGVDHPVGEARKVEAVLAPGHVEHIGCILVLAVADSALLRLNQRARLIYLFQAVGFPERSPQLGFPVALKRVDRHPVFQATFAAGLWIHFRKNFAFQILHILSFEKSSPVEVEVHFDGGKENVEELGADADKTECRENAKEKEDEAEPDYKGGDEHEPNDVGDQQRVEIDHTRCADPIARQTLVRLVLSRNHHNKELNQSNKQDSFLVFLPPIK